MPLRALISALKMRIIIDFIFVQMTQRLDLYAKSFTEAASPGYKPELIREGGRENF